MKTPPPKPVPHASDHPTLRCTCASCIDARRDELRRRLEEKRRDQRIADMAHLEDLAGRGLVFKPLKRPQPGTQPALRKLGRAS